MAFEDFTYEIASFLKKDVTKVHGFKDYFIYFSSIFL